MKKSLFIAVFALLFSLNGRGQCLPNGITFNTQAQINSFHANYPGCTKILGDVTIDPQPAGNITNLNGLSGLTFIGGTLTIAHCTNLTNLTGLSSLDSIGGSLYVFNTWVISSLSGLGTLKFIGGSFIFYDNHGFNNFTGLNALTSIGGSLEIFANPVLNNLNGLNTLTSIGNLKIQDNIALTNLSGLNNLTTVGNNIQIGGSISQTNAALTSLSGLDNLTSVGGTLSISDNPVLQNLNGLGNLNALKAINVYDNQKLTSLAGLTSLNSVQQDVRIIENPLLTDLVVLEHFTVCNGYLEISGNTALTSLSALQNFTTLSNGFKIAGSPAITSLAGLANVTTVGGGFTIEAMDGLTNLNGLENINIINGSSVTITGNASLTSLNGLNPNISHFDYLNINENASLTDLQGLENLITIGTTSGGQLSISRNPLLTSLNGLQNLGAVLGNFVLDGNPSLQTLTGLDNLASIRTLSLVNNDNLLNLSGLEKLTSLSTFYLTGNSSPAFNLSGLTNLTHITNLWVSNTTQLKNLVGLEGVSITGGVEIADNALMENLNGMQGSTTLGAVGIYGNLALTSLTGLENVTKIYDGLIIDGNPVLADLNGLSNLKTLQHNLFVHGNHALSDCAVLGLCLFISDPPQSDSIAVENNAPGCNTPAEVSSFCTSTAVTVEVLVDNNASCTSGLPVADVPVRFTGGIQTTLKPTNAEGQAKFRYFDTPPFQITLPQLSEPHWNVCETRQNYVASNGSDSTHVSLFLSPKVQCPELNVKLNLPSNFRGCLVNSDLRVSVQNTGTLLAEGGKVAVVMPPVFDLLSAQPLMSGQNGDTLYFEVGDLKPFETALVKLQVKTKCDTFLLGQTLCWEAFAALDNACPTTGQAFSEIKLSVKCVGDTLVRFTMKNIGDAPTQGWHEYRIFRNETVLYYNAFTLNAQQSVNFEFPAEGATWRMEATKFDNGTHTAVALENCGGLTPGLITAFWLDHGPVDYDFDCRQVVQSYDPNRKTAVPTGTGFDHIISPYEPIYYTIEFQNTGTDTAFRVQLLDHLSDNLDINTFKPQGASHPCSWEVRGKNLEVLFLPIALPDSNANEAASHGYFSFSIFPKQNLADGNQIYNFAQIIFDYNWPIWTNWVDHTIGQLTVSVDEPQAHANLWQVIGNPTRDIATFRAESFVAGEKRFELLDAGGRMLRSAEFSGQEFDFQRDMLPEGMYFFRISDAQNRVFTGKIVVAE